MSLLEVPKMPDAPQGGKTPYRMRAEYGDLRFEWPKRYAAAAEVNWTNHT